MLHYFLDKFEHEKNRCMIFDMVSIKKEEWNLLWIDEVIGDILSRQPNWNG